MAPQWLPIGSLVAPIEYNVKLTASPSLFRVSGVVLGDGRQLRHATTFTFSFASLSWIGIWFSLLHGLARDADPLKGYTRCPWKWYPQPPLNRYTWGTKLFYMAAHTLPTPFISEQNLCIMIRSEGGNVWVACVLVLSQILGLGDGVESTI